jgi:uncharacterized membrane protein (UPF0127 family)
MAGVLLGCGSSDPPVTPPPPPPITNGPSNVAPTTGVAPTVNPTKISTAVAGSQTPVYSGPAVRIRDSVFPVELAIESSDRRQGLSDRPSLDQGTGMLFIFEEAQSLNFWMRNMQFPLDMIWIDAECRLVDIFRHVPVPPPGIDDSDLPRYGPGADVRFVLEINAGESVRAGLNAGDGVEFLGPIDGKYGC